MDNNVCDYLKGLKEYWKLRNTKFEYVYRCRALSIDHKGEFENSYSRSLWENGYVDVSEANLGILKEGIFSIIQDEESHYLFWLCHCLRYHGKSLLDRTVPFIERTSRITRGGINTYKRNGWTVHVLYVYQLVNYNFANGIVPGAFNWKFDVKKLFASFQESYRRLSHDAKFVLKTACLIHDIGVQVAVNNHEALGVPFVEQGLNMLDYTAENLELAGINLTRDELVCLLREIVGNHQIINQVSAEESDYLICNKINIINEKLSTSLLHEIFQNEFSNIMFLLGAADMMAVDDTLLSEVKFNEMREAEEYIKLLIDHGPYRRDEKTYGMRRIKCFVNDSLKGMPDAEIQTIIEENGFNPDELFRFMYDVQSVSYGIAAVKPLNSMELSVKFICLLYSIISRDNINFENIAVKVDAGFDEQHVRKLLQKPVSEAANELKYEVVTKDSFMTFTFFFKEEKV